MGLKWRSPRWCLVRMTPVNSHSLTAGFIDTCVWLRTLSLRQVFSLSLCQESRSDYLGLGMVYEAILELILVVCQVPSAKYGEVQPYCGK